MPVVRSTLTWKDFIACAFPGCPAKVTDTDLCPTCNRFICAVHRSREPSTDTHVGEAHWNEETK